MRAAVLSLLLVALVVLPGCYHATINTGLSPGSEVYQEKWAKSFVYGLVPPDAVDVMQQCSSRVARVETRHSFLNGLVGALTWGIFTPMEITVTCAGGGMEDAASAVIEDAAAFQAALDLGEPFLVRVP